VAHDIEADKLKAQVALLEVRLKQALARAEAAETALQRAQTAKRTKGPAKEAEARTPCINPFPGLCCLLEPACGRRPRLGHFA
jgi:hypothetical protein